MTDTQSQRRENRINNLNDKNMEKEFIRVRSIKDITIFTLLDMDKVEDMILLYGKKFILMILKNL